jgi:DNA mismatch endonuclease (patch repair protein)
MAAVRQRGTKAELAVREQLDCMGIAYEVCDSRLPGSPDIVLKDLNIPIFVHGCFWHQHRNCHLATMPKTNVDYWQRKFAENRQRDRLVLKALKQLGLSPLVIWQCQAQNSKSTRRILARVSRTEAKVAN